MRTVLAFFDPARPGCWRRFTRGLLGCFGLVGCGLVVAAVLAARQPMGRYVVGATLVSTGQFGPGLTVASRLVDDYPERNAAFYLLKASAQRNLGDIEGHNRSLDEAVAHFPRSFAANDDRCLYGALHGDPKAALPFCDTAVALVESTASSQAFAHRGLARALAGDRAGAIDDLETAESARLAEGISDERFGYWYGRMLADLKAGRAPMTAEELVRDRRLR